MIENLKIDTDTLTEDLITHPFAIAAIQHRRKVESTFGKIVNFETIKTGLDSDNPQTRQESARKIWAVTPIDKIPELMRRAITDQDETVQFNALERYWSTPICLNYNLFTDNERQAFKDQYESAYSKQPSNPTRSNLDSSNLLLLNIKH